MQVKTSSEFSIEEARIPGDMKLFVSHHVISGTEPPHFTDGNIQNARNLFYSEDLCCNAQGTVGLAISKLMLEDVPSFPRII